jgi:hypothetical protein
MIIASQWMLSQECLHFRSHDTVLLFMCLQQYADPAHRGHTQKDILCQFGEEKAASSSSRSSVWDLSAHVERWLTMEVEVPGVAGNEARVWKKLSHYADSDELLIAPAP